MEDIIWEVDDDRDGGLTWEEFSALYERIRNDQDGKEPHRMCAILTVGDHLQFVLTIVMLHRSKRTANSPY